MKRLSVSLITLELLLVATVTAQQPAAQGNQPTTVGCMTIEAKGDSLWRISERVFQDPQKWETIYNRNPFLRQPGRRYVNRSNGWTYVFIKPGEQLCGLDELGIIPKLADIQELQTLGFTPPKPATVVVERTSPWAWVPLALLLVAALALLAVYRWFRRDPTRVGAGRVVEQGINTPAEAAAHFRERISYENGIGRPSVRILNLVRGRAHGWARVSDRVGSMFRRILNGEPTWEVTAQLPDGSQVIRYSLIACANDVRAGGGMMPGFGFRFVPDQNVTEQVQTPAPAPAAQATPELPDTNAMEPLTSDGIIKIELRPDDEEHRGMRMVRLGGVQVSTFTFEQTRRRGGEITFRFREEEEVKEPVAAS